MSESGFAGELRMDLSPSSAPVYGGGIIEIGLFGELEIPEFARLFLVFDGCKQRQVTEAKIINSRRLQAVIPDHEPPEIVALSLIVKLPSNGPCQTIAQDTFTYFLDQTCYLARYLADSVHDLDALEDWDFIQGPLFSLANEDFPTLDERLTSAFQHLILPPTWNLLGDPTTKTIARETLFHFAARLGLSSFVTLLLEKNGSDECLLISNKHGELAQDIARSKSYNGLADLITDPHAHGVIRWESTQYMSPTTTIKKHSFGTVTMSSEMHQGDFQPIEEEISTICHNHAPPPPDKPVLDENQLYNGVVSDEYNVSQDLEITNTTNATWGSVDDSSDELPPPPPDMTFEDHGPPPIPPKPIDLYDDYEDDDFIAENDENSGYTAQNEASSYFSTTSGDFPPDNEVVSYPESEDTETSEGILDGNLRHLQKINLDIQYIRQKDSERLKESSPSESVRLSNSCPNLGQEASFVSTDTEYLESYNSPASARTRKGLAVQDYESAFQPPMMPYGSESDLQQQHGVDPLVYSHDDQTNVVFHTGEESKEVTPDDDEEDTEDEDDERSDSPSRRPHSWHSVEKIDEMKPGAVPNNPTISHKRSQSYQGDESSRPVHDQQVELTPEEKAEQADTITSPAIRRVRRHNNNAFAIVAQDKEEEHVNDRALKARSVNASGNNNNNVLEQDRRFTISEGTLPDPSNFETDGDTPGKPRNEISTLPAPVRQDAPTSKSSVSRTISFLQKMRNSTRTKTSGSKERTKKSDAKQISSKVHGLEDNLTESKEKESQRNFSWNAVKKAPKPAPHTNNQRAQSMMINKLPTTYGPSLPYFTNDGRVHGLPVVRTSVMNRPTTTYEPNKVLEAAVPDGKYSRLSYKDDGDSSSLHSGSRTPPQLSHFPNNGTGSTESLNEVAAVDNTELENDPDLKIKDGEPEAWSVTVKKKFLSKMHKSDVKRQDNIFEFIQKERSFLTTLKILQKIFAHGMLKELQFEQDTVDKMFPQIDEFVEFTSNFVERLNERQNEDKVVAQIGDILVSQWSRENGRRMMWLFSEFCGKQKEITAMYKDMMKNNKKFQDFINRCSKNPLTRRRDIPGCILLITQRITKYPVILETLIKNSREKDHSSDILNVKQALELVKEIIQKVNDEVHEYEKRQEVTEIYQKMESKSYATYKDGRKFTRDHFYMSIPKLLQVGTLQWRPNTVKRSIDVTIVLFKEVLVFLQENNQRYSFTSVSQPAAVPLRKLIVREKAGEDSVLFLLSASSDKPEMYELVFQSATESKQWMQWIRSAVEDCPEEDEVVSSQDVAEQKLMEQKWQRADHIISELERTDKEVNHLLQEKMKKFKALANVLEKPEITVNMKHSYPTYLLDTEDPKSRTPLEGAPTLLKAINQLNKLSHLLCGPGGLNRAPSNEHSGTSLHVSSLPKRSETFGGFDNGKKPQSQVTKFATIGPKYPHKHDSEEEMYQVGTKTAMAHSDGDLTATTADSCSEEDSSSSSQSQQDMVTSPTADQMSALLRLTQSLDEYMSIATQQDSHVQKMSIKLTQLQSKRRNGDKFIYDEARRNHAKQTEMEQDLMKREEQLKSEKDQWNKEFKKAKAAIEYDKREMEEKMKKYKLIEEDLKRSQEEMRRKEEDYQKRLVRLREMQKKANQDQTSSHSSSHPSAHSANRNNSNSTAGAFEDEDGFDDNQNIRNSKGSFPGLGSLPGHLSKSHSSLEGELEENPVTKDSSHSPTYSNTEEYPRTFPGTGKRDPSTLTSQQSNTALLPAGQAGASKPIHLQFSANNQLIDHKLPPRSSLLPGNLASKSKQVIPGKLKATQSSQSSSKPTFTDGLKSKLPFSHKKVSRPVSHSSLELQDTKQRSSTLTIPGHMKHSKSDVNIDINSRNRSTSSPNPITSLHPPETESGLERSNSASSNSSKEGNDKKKGKKRRSWGSNNEKTNEKEIYF